MSNIVIDTKKMEVDKKYLLSLNQKYVSYIQSIKSLINKTDYWKGIDADNFRDDLKETCMVYDEVGSLLKEYANFYTRNIPIIEKQAELDLIK